MDSAKGEIIVRDAWNGDVRDDDNEEEKYKNCKSI